MNKRTFLGLMMVLMPLALLAQLPIALSEKPMKNGMTLVGQSVRAEIYVADADAEVVRTAANCLADDIHLVCGQRPSVINSSRTTAPLIVAGTLGRSPLVDQLAAEGKIDVGDVRDRWEVYSLQLIESPRMLVIAGSTPRGTAYGLFELSRLMGVSPYVWWADVTPEHKAALYVGGNRTVSKEPSVKFRGIFINDEDWGLQPWAKKGIDKMYNNIGPNAYARVMELLLRLRANTLWPAMHRCSEAFWANKANLPIARKYDIVLGSSHCEQMLRDNEWEWRNAPYNGTNEDWNYVTNKAKVQGYWEERVKESVGYDAMYTLGMRGVHDWGISGYPTTEDKVHGLTEIIQFQRGLLDKYFGDATQIPQLFIPYKEVLDAYNAGLQVPEDVTLCWVDDNHGYIRQLPRPAEQARSGGNGIYHHLSYWGTPEDYLWLCSHSPSLLSFELSKAYDQGIRTLWILNVGDIKPAEMELEFFADLAWDIDKWTPDQACTYNREWAARTFGQRYAREIADIKYDYYRLAAGGKPEHVHMVHFTNTDKDRRIRDYQALAAKVERLKARIPQRLQDAYFQLIEYPVKGSYYQNVKTFRAAQSLELAKAGQRQVALQYADEARQAFESIQSLTEKYNKEIAGGKWDGIMTYAPRKRPHFGLPPMAVDSIIADVQTALPTQRTIDIPATRYKQKTPSVVALPGLGLDGSSLAVWPLDMKAYTLDALSAAPYVEYALPMEPGKNHIEVRCLPSFPINTDYDLRVALSVDGGSPTLHSLKTVAMKGKWHTTVVQGFSEAATDFTCSHKQTIRLRVSLMDPGVVVSAIRITPSADN